MGSFQCFVQRGWPIHAHVGHIRFFQGLTLRRADNLSCSASLTHTYSAVSFVWLYRYGIAMELINKQIQFRLSAAKTGSLIKLADQLDIGQSTLRRWAGLRYADLLSGTR